MQRDGNLHKLREFWRAGARFNWRKILTKILMKILTKVKFEKETCTNYFFMNFLL